MSLLTLIKAQFGKSNTPANNFVLDASADNGTMKLARGNAGATTQDILKVDANGKVTFPQATSGITSDMLQGGNIIKMYRSTVTFDGTGTASITFPDSFPTSVTALTLTNSNIGVGGEGVVLTAFSVTTSGFNCRAIKNNPYGVFVGSLELSYIAIGC